MGVDDGTGHMDFSGTTGTTRGISGTSGGVQAPTIIINGGVHLPNVTKPGQFAKGLASEVQLRTGRRSM